MFALKNFVGKQGKHHLSGATNLKGRLLFCFCFVERLKQGEMSNGYTGYTPLFFSVVEEQKSLPNSHCNFKTSDERDYQ